METVEMIDLLRSVDGFVVVASGDPGKKLVYTADDMKEIAERLEEMEEHIEVLKDDNRQLASACIDPNEGRFSEWISVEDEPFPGLEKETNKQWNLYLGDLPSYFVYYEDGKGITHWMRLEPPKPKVPTFGDVLLEKFPKAQVYDEGHPKTCVALVFGGKCSSYKYDKCIDCWNQPYFEEKE